MVRHTIPRFPFALAFQKILRNLEFHTFRLHLKQDKEIVSGPPAAQAFPEDVDRDGQQGQEQARAAKDVHDLFRPIGCDPVVGEVAEAVEHEILLNGSFS